MLPKELLGSMQALFLLDMDFISSNFKNRHFCVNQIEHSQVWRFDHAPHARLVFAIFMDILDYCLILKKLGLRSTVVNR